MIWITRSVFGGVVIMIGVYAVLWGKGKETEGDQ